MLEAIEQLLDRWRDDMPNWWEMSLKPAAIFYDILSHMGVDDETISDIIGAPAIKTVFTDAQWYLEEERSD
jgi:hypothetical protein